MNQYTNKYTEDDLKKKCLELNLTYVGFHKDKKKGKMVEFICEKHRDKGIQTADWSHFKDYTKGCKYCAGKNLTTEDIQKKIKNKDVILISEYQGNNSPITCKCRRCGNVWTTVPRVLTTNGGGCPVCGKEKANGEETKSQEDFVKDLAIANPTIQVIGQYTGCKNLIKCKCLIDGTVWESHASNLLNNTAGCPTCNMSNGQRKMLTILKNMGFKITRQYKFPDCKYKTQLRFDGYDEENNVAYEFNGEQHYKKKTWGHISDEEAERQLKLNQTRDKIKIDYCKKNNIPLIIIPYWDFNNMEEIIKDKLIKIGII